MNHNDQIKWASTQMCDNCYIWPKSYWSQIGYKSLEEQGLVTSNCSACLGTGLNPIPYTELEQ